MVRELRVFVIFIIAWGIMFYPALLFLNEGFLGGIRSDPAAYIYYFIHNINRVVTLPSAGFDGNYFYPFGNSLAFSDNFILPALIGKPIYLLTGNYSLAYNIVMVLAPVTSGYLTFCLVRYIIRKELPAFVAGFAFMCLPFIYGHLGHPQLQFSFGIPAIILATLIFAEKRTPLSATAIGFIVFIQFFSTVYYSLISYLLAGLILFAYSLMKFKTITKRDLFVLIGMNIPWIVALLFVIKPYLAVRDAFDPWSIDLVTHFSATIKSYLAMSLKHKIWGFLNGPLASNGSFLSVGVIVSTLAVVSVAKIGLFLPTIFTLAGLIFAEYLEPGVYKAYVVSISLWFLLVFLTVKLYIKRSSETKNLQLEEYTLLIFFLFTFFFFASFGIIEKKAHTELYYYLYSYLPGYNGLRAAYRFGIVAGFMLILLSTISISKMRTVLIFLSLVGIGVEYKTRPYSPSIDTAKPKIYKKLDEIQSKGAVVSLPFGSPFNGLDYSRRHTAYMLWTLDSGRPMVSGWSSKLPAYYQFKGRFIDKFPSQISLNTLGQLVGVRYVLLNAQFIENFKIKTFLDELARVNDQVKILHQTRRGNLLIEIDPEVRLHELSAAELYLPPGKKRKLTIEIRSDKPTKITVFTPEPNLIELNQTPKLIKLDIPKSKHLIKPHKIRFSATGSKVFIRTRDLENTVVK